MSEKIHKIPRATVSIGSIALGASLGICNELHFMNWDNSKLGTREGAMAVVRSTAMGAILGGAAIFIGSTLHNWHADRRNEMIEMKNQISEIKSFTERYEQEKEKALAAQYALPAL